MNGLKYKVPAESAKLLAGNKIAHVHFSLGYYSVDGRFAGKVAEGESVGCLPRGVYVVKQDGKAEKVMF